MIRYHKLFALLNNRGMKKSDLLEILSSKTIAKLSKGANLNTDVIDKICNYLKCQPGDIMEYVDERDFETAKQEMFEEFGKLMVKLEKATGKSKDELMDDFIKVAPKFITKDDDFKDIQAYIDTKKE